MSVSLEQRGGFPNPDALELQAWADSGPDGAVTLVARHPADPFVAQVPKGNIEQIQKQALIYLRAMSDHADAGRLAPFLRALGDPEHPQFRWLKVATSDDLGQARPIASRYLFRRKRNPKTVESQVPPAQQVGARGSTRPAARPQRALILLASQVINGFVLGSGFGVRVVVRLGDLDGDTQTIRMNGFSASLPSSRFSGEGLLWAEGDRFAPFVEFLRKLPPAIGTALQLSEGSVFIRGIRLAKDKRIQVRGRGLSDSDELRGLPYEFVADVETAEADPHTAIRAARKFPLVACAGGQTRVFKSDPASQADLAVQGPPSDFRLHRPTRKDAALDLCRGFEDEPQPLASPEVEVLRSRYVVADLPPVGIKSVPLPKVYEVRSNDFSAISAYRNLQQIFVRFDLYGIDANHYFWLADLPLQAHYRSGVSPGLGKNGQTVNGRSCPRVGRQAKFLGRRSATAPSWKCISRWRICRRELASPGMEPNALKWSRSASQPIRDGSGTRQRTF